MRVNLADGLASAVFMILLISMFRGLMGCTYVINSDGNPIHDVTRLRQADNHEQTNHNNSDNKDRNDTHKNDVDVSTEIKAH